MSRSSGSIPGSLPAKVVVVLLRHIAGTGGVRLFRGRSDVRAGQCSRPQVAATQNKISLLLETSHYMRGTLTDITANLAIAQYRYEIGGVDMTRQDPDVGRVWATGTPG
ncbi:MAG: hypothetical protein NC095_04430 [Muribaculum sp.]|nr:hypothetical protein [Muribaculum sp.]